MTTAEPKFDLWCLVELFGHQKIAGRCSEQNIAGTNMLRVDVPETEHHPAFTRLFGSAAIYAINPISEPLCKEMARRLQVTPLAAYDLHEVLQKHMPALPAAIADNGERDDNDDELGF